MAGSETAVEKGAAYECITNLGRYMKMPAELYPISELKIYRNYKKTTLRPYPKLSVPFVVGPASTAQQVRQDRGVKEKW